MVEELGDDWKAADQNTCCNLTPRPNSHFGHVIARVVLLRNLPGSVRAHNRRYTGTEYSKWLTNIRRRHDEAKIPICFVSQTIFRVSKQSQISEDHSQDACPENHYHHKLLS